MEGTPQPAREATVVRVETLLQRVFLVVWVLLVLSSSIFMVAGGATVTTITVATVATAVQQSEPFELAKVATVEMDFSEVATVATEPTP